LSAQEDPTVRLLLTTWALPVVTASAFAQAMPRPPMSASPAGRAALSTAAYRVAMAVMDQGMSVPYTGDATVIALQA
jgi:hypothetical protein